MSPLKKYGVGIDIGGTHTRVVIADREGQRTYSQQLSSLSDFPALVKRVQGVLQEAALSESDVIAMGIGVAGITDCARGIVIDAPALQWRNFPLLDEIRSFFHFPIFVENDVNCAAWGEKWLGAARGLEDFFFISLGTGVGSAIVANGDVIRGKHFMAGEIGYFLEKSDLHNGRKNKGGEFGLFEQKVSGTALRRHFSSSHEFLQHHQVGNERTREIMGELILDLSVALANVVSLLNPEKVILGGGVSESLTSVIDLIRATVACLTPIQTQIEMTQLGDQAGALGAIAHALQRLEMQS